MMGDLTLLFSKFNTKNFEELFFEYFRAKEDNSNLHVKSKKIK